MTKREPINVEYLDAINGERLHSSRHYVQLDRGLNAANLIKILQTFLAMSGSRIPAITAIKINERYVSFFELKTVYESDRTAHTSSGIEPLHGSALHIVNARSFPDSNPGGVSVSTAARKLASAEAGIIDDMKRGFSYGYSIQSGLLPAVPHGINKLGIFAGAAADGFISAADKDFSWLASFYRAL